MEGSSSSSLKLKAEWGPAICMVLIEVFTTGQMLLTKVVVDAGLFVFALLTYRFLLGTLLVVPLAIIFERGKWKEIKLKAFIWIFTSALVGFTIPGLYYIGLGDTSPGYAINFYNIIPIATFVLAVLFRKEPLNLKSLVGNIKVIGTLVCVGGTLVISLYKGKVLHLWPTNIIGYHPKQSGSAFGHHHMRGTVLLIISCLSLAVWYTVQAQMLKVFPYKYWSTVTTCFVGCIQMAVVGVAMNREKATWQLKWNMSLLTIVYSAILNTAAKFVMISWVVTQRGPTYPSMFCAKVSSIWTIRSITLNQVSSITWEALIKMSPYPRLSAAQYVAHFKPQEQYEDGDQELSDAESRVGDIPMENVVMGWTTKFHIMVPKADAFFHDMLTRTLDNYYYDWEATLEYRSAEYSHPWMDSYWETELWVKKRDPTTKESKVESKFITRVSRATVEISMEDVAFNAFVYYHGLRSDKTLKGALRHFPCFLHDKGIWTVPLADDSSLTLQATVGLARELALHEVDLKDELLKEKELKEQAYKEIDQLRAELGHPKIYEKLN